MNQPKQDEVDRIKKKNKKLKVCSKTDKTYEIKLHDSIFMV